MALAGLSCLEHRGGSLEGTGDGAGLLLSTPAHFFKRFILPGRRLPEEQALLVGVVFLPASQPSNLPHWKREMDGVLRRHGFVPLGWRRVPTEPSALGAQARASSCEIWQVIAGEGMVPPEELLLSCWRVKVEWEQRLREIYIASFSPRTLVYKALATGRQLRAFYPDLADPSFGTDAVVFHRRFSTNTFSNWYLAQVFRTLGHNGEINTIKANRNAVANLQKELGLAPILMQQGSDSADMDRVVELFLAHGVSLPETLCRLMPMAWRDLPRLAPESKRFLQGVQRALGSLGAWEGPAAIVSMGADHLVGALDRMGLRPLRWMTTRSGRFILGSELGAIPIPFEDIDATGQLDPGEAIAVQLSSRRVLKWPELLAGVVAATPINFGDLSEVRLAPLPRRAPAETTGAPAKADRAALDLFGWTQARIRVVEHLAKTGKEPITSMGFDRPLPVLSAHRPPLTKYLKQIVAVVTNPPIDPIREAGAFDLTVHLGPSPKAHENEPIYNPQPQYRLPSPFLTTSQVSEIRAAAGPERPSALQIDCTFEDPSALFGEGARALHGAKAISRRIAEICRQVVVAVKKGEASVIILSDREALSSGTSARRLPLPMVLVASAAHNSLVEEGLRRSAGLIVETGEIQEGHDAAVFIANGATALCPYLFFEVGLPHGPLENLLSGLEDTLRRVMSKMGICSVDGYRGSRLFEAVGLAPSICEHYLPGITSRIGGIELEDLYQDLQARTGRAEGTHREGDISVYRKEVWQELQTVARGHDPQAYHRFLALVAETPPVYLRDLLRLVPREAPIAIDEVQSEEEIIASCFRGAAMSLGALHRVAHEAIAAAFNEHGAMSNCGEGGEDPARDRGGPREQARSRIRQVASGRFGVDARYLVHADELSIKIGQGAKPGEGGMLPAGKVTEEIARIRRTQQGVTLISPPPHHDIYSIEDLAQLIFNLRQVNPQARISVKVPGVTDIGTIAVGIAKAGADVIDVSGFEGGTGAASSSSIEHAGLPLERALSETHQALVLNGVRNLVRLRADGGIKTGFDVAAVVALGADEVSLGTALMIAEQCIFCHGCANGLCPAGITTQSDRIARRLMTDKKGRPRDDLLPDDEQSRYQDARQAVLRYLMSLAGDVREKLASLGLTTIGQLVGRVDLIERGPRATQQGGWMAERAAKVDLSEIVADPGAGGRPTPTVRLALDSVAPLNARICEDAREGQPLRYTTSSTDRAIGATIAGVIAAGRFAPPAEGITLQLAGYTGQGLGFACVEGMRIDLEGFANDTVGEVMSGGTIAIRGPKAIAPETRGTLSVCGNAAAYGATGGRLFVEGRAGQRVGVRNSGATVVVEGAGKYAFEYMTGGVGVVLGPVGPVIGSGMTGGVLYLLDDGSVAEKIHRDVRVEPLAAGDRDVLRRIIEEHLRVTGSHRAASLLGGWDAGEARFVKVCPAPA
jgi:glutamate synthase domain-containing protein 2/glutamate synthase domain-containing protein 1/glutamate synthase domain-containing protein 3